jgi:hypothetical protein
MEPVILNSFRTKTGFCHVLQDKLVLTREGIIGEMASVTTGNSILRPLVVEGILCVVFFYAAYACYQFHTTYNTYQAIVFLLLGVSLSFGMITSLNNSATPIIERNSIQEVKFKKGIRLLTRSRFEVFFENENGKVKKRLILLPGSLMDSQQAETNKALRIMEENGILVR